MFSTPVPLTVVNLIVGADYTESAENNLKAATINDRWESSGCYHKVPLSKELNSKWQTWLTARLKQSPREAAPSVSLVSIFLSAPLVHTSLRSVLLFHSYSSSSSKLHMQQVHLFTPLRLSFRLMFAFVVGEII